MGQRVTISKAFRRQLHSLQYISSVIGFALDFAFLSNLSFTADRICLIRETNAFYSVSDFKLIDVLQESVLCSPFVLSLPLVINGVAVRIPTNCSLFDVNGPNMGSGSGRFSQAKSFSESAMVFEPFVRAMRKKVMKLLMTSKNPQTLYLKRFDRLFDSKTKFTQLKANAAAFVVFQPREAVSLAHHDDLRLLSFISNGFLIWLSLKKNKKGEAITHGKNDFCGDSRN
uniref:Uncharacterized protein n=1 Tax=Cucumis melo TaxID=3656 RepID=A0A9I9EC58_CUCME